MGLVPPSGLSSLHPDTYVCKEAACKGAACSPQACNDARILELN